MKFTKLERQFYTITESGIIAPDGFEYVSNAYITSGLFYKYIPADKSPGSIQILMSSVDFNEKFRGLLNE